MKDISLVKLLPIQPKVPFISLRVIAGILSVLAIIASIFLFSVRGLNYGIDFTGGTVLQIDTGGPAPLADLRSELNGLGLGAMELQEISPPPDAGKSYKYVRVTVPLQPETEDSGGNAQTAALTIVKDKIKEVTGEYIIRETSLIGGKVSGELRRKGILAIVLAMSMVLFYIWFRFEWQFAVGAVLALVHDVILTIGVFALVQIDFNLAIIAAILTIVGYSLNDTVIVYDRIRENMRKYKKMAFPELLNLSINDTLSRTIMTSLTTLLALTSLYVLGGPGLNGFAFAMIWGVFVGTYSSIFVASPLLLVLKLKRRPVTEST